MKNKSWMLGGMGVLGWLLCIPTMLIWPFFTIWSIDFVDITKTLFLLLFLSVTVILLYILWISTLIALCHIISSSTSKKTGPLLIISALYIGGASVIVQGVFGLVGPILILLTGLFSDTTAHSQSPNEQSIEEKIT